MTHQVKHYKLSRDSKHRKSLIYNLIRSTILYKKIKTTVAKAKCIQPILEKLITKAKVQHSKNGEVNELGNFRNLLSFFRNDETTVKELIKIANILKDVKGGYSKIVKIGQRKGDSAHIAYLLFSNKEIV